MDDACDDAYAAVYDEQDRERTQKTNATASPSICCLAVLVIFAVAVLAMAIL